MATDSNSFDVELKEDGAPRRVIDRAGIEQALGYTFRDPEWLERALTHRSAPAKLGRSDYERLEFIGDAVLDLAIAHLLSENHRDAREGDLSKMRATLVNTAYLAKLSKRLNLGPSIKLGRGEISSGGCERPSILADVLEALIGAVYNDSGFDAALRVIRGLYGDDVKTVEPRDPKTELQEALHAEGREAPVYQLEFVEGPEHSPTFVSLVSVGGEVLGRGRGATKKASQQLAAAEALQKLQRGVSALAQEES